MKRLLPFLLIPILLTYGPNGVGYETIVETTLDDFNIKIGSKMACNVLTDSGEHRLIEGLLYQKNPLIIFVDTPLFKGIPLLIKDVDMEFCLMSDSQVK